MRWIKPNLRGSLFSLLGSTTHGSEAVLNNRIDRIRQSMLDCLGDAGTHRYPQLVRKIRFSADPLALWYARGDLMGALAALHGEAVARAHMGHLTPLFNGLLPEGMTARVPAPAHAAVRSTGARPPARLL
jgi:hypothetical protein